MGGEAQAVPEAAGAGADAVWRLFLAIGIGEDVRGQLAEIQRTLRRTGARVSWVPPENLHLTLVFLGDGFAARVPELVAAVDSAASMVAPFRLDVAGVGWFGSARSPRVVWAGVPDAPPALADLYGRCAAAAAAWGARIEDRPYKAHLTLGRVRSARGAAALTAAMAERINTRAGTVDVSRVLLMRSALLAQGARYTLLHESFLKGA